MFVPQTESRQKPKKEEEEEEAFALSKYLITVDELEETHQRILQLPAKSEKKKQNQFYPPLVFPHHR